MEEISSRQSDRTSTQDDAENACGIPPEEVKKQEVRFCCCMYD